MKSPLSADDMMEMLAGYDLVPHEPAEDEEFNFIVRAGRASVHVVRKKNDRRIVVVAQGRLGEPQRSKYLRWPAPKQAAMWQRCADRVLAHGVLQWSTQLDPKEPQHATGFQVLTVVYPDASEHEFHQCVQRVGTAVVQVLVAMEMTPA